MKRLLSALAIAAVCCGLALDVRATDEVPGSPQKGPVALVGATIYPVTSAPIEKGTLLFEGGKIVAVGADVELPDGVTVVDVSGKYIYPGLFEPYSQLGLTEIEQVAATIDMSETGDVNPNVRALVAVNPDSELIPVTRAAGVLLAVTAPTGGLVSGKAAVLQLDGWTYEDMCVEDCITLQINWPSARSQRFGRRGGGGDEGGGDRYTGQVRELRDLFAEAASYHAGRETRGAEQPVDLRLEALVPVVTGQTPLMVRADTLRQIQDAVAFAAEHKVRLVLLGGYDAPLCKDLLKKHNVAVIVSAVQRRPLRRSDPYEMPYTLPARLAEAGIPFCISCSDRSSTWNTRNLPHQAAMAAAWGLDRAEALKSVTLYPAQILGVDERVGSLEPGKDATLFVADGDALEITTRVSQAWIQGRVVDLNNRHKRLYDKYRQKYEQLGTEILP